MKIILSRKGFDSQFGGYPSPIFPDGKMISLPIPARSLADWIRYSDLVFKGKSLYKIMEELNPKIKIDGEWKTLIKGTKCHLDPDIYENLIKRPRGWRPIFGQIMAAQAHLENRGVKEGDLFLFFGWFRKTKYLNGKLIFHPKDKGRHIIFGYFQIGKKLRVNVGTKVPQWAKYHPHTKLVRRKTKNNTIYISRKTLSWNKNLPGAGFFDFHHSLILTKNGFLRSIWNLPLCFKKAKISYHSSEDWKGNLFKAKSRGQEFVIEDNKEIEKWAKNLIQQNWKYKK